MTAVGFPWQTEWDQAAASDPDTTCSLHLVLQLCTLKWNSDVFVRNAGIPSRLSRVFKEGRFFFFLFFFPLHFTKSRIEVPGILGSFIQLQNRVCRQLGNKLPLPSALSPCFCMEHSKERGLISIDSLFLCSSAERDRQTAEGLAAELPSFLTLFWHLSELVWHSALQSQWQKNASCYCRAGGQGYQRTEGLKSREIHPSCKLCYQKH